MLLSQNKALYLFLGILLLASAAVFSFARSLERESFLMFKVLDVGQGDAVFIETPDRYQVLVDGGPDGRILSRLGEELPWWDRSLDLVILTHPHADHVAGLNDVLDRYRVSAIIEPDISYGTGEYEMWKKKSEEEGAKLYTAVEEMEVKLGEYALLKILAPGEEKGGIAPKNVHERNVVSELVIDDIRFLLMGDGEVKEEYRLFWSNLLRKVDVLKVGHHGSRTSTSDLLLQSTRPSFAVISAGKKNRYGHPHPEVLERLGRYSVKIFRTDIDGSVGLKTDGEKVIREE